VIGHYARYLVGWAIAGTGLVLALATAFPAVAGESGPSAALAGVCVAAATDLVVFAIVLRALAADARRFPVLWGLSVALKVLVFGSAIAFVAGSGCFPAAGFVRVLIVAFVTFAHHEVLWLCLINRGSSRLGAQRC
jgi:hypothetical protein